jgi:hypothetical protein
MQPSANSHRMFTGKEVEGRHYGRHTLFVEGLVPAQDIIRAARHHKVAQIYFGANYMGGVKVRSDTVKEPSAFSPNTIWKVVEETCSYNASVKLGDQRVVTLDCSQDSAIRILSSCSDYLVDLFIMVSLAPMEEVDPKLLKHAQSLSYNIQLKFPYRAGVVVMPLDKVLATTWDQYKTAGDKLL